MTDHKANIYWQRNGAGFEAQTYSRDHQLVFENDLSILASAAPAYAGNPTAVNPETLLLGSLASCHMLTFLAVCAKRGIVVDDYQDEAVGVLGKNADGKISIVKVTLRPKVQFSADKTPRNDELHKLHDKAHEHCFIANTLACEMIIEPQP